MKSKMVNRLMAAATAAMFGTFLGHTAQANSPTVNNVDWILAGSGNWNAAGTNWSGGIIPNNTSTNVYDVSLDLADGGIYNVTIPSNASYNVDGLTLSNANAALTIAANGILDISQPDNNGASGTLSVQQGDFTLNGTLANSVLSVGVGGTFSSNSGTFENVVLGSNLSVGSYQALNVTDSLNNSYGLNAAGELITLNVGAGLVFTDTFDPKFNRFVPNILNGTMDMTGYNNYLTAQNGPTELAGTVNVLAANGTEYMNGNGLLWNNGYINVGSNGTIADAVSGSTLYINASAFNNTGNITVFNSSTLNATAFTNSGTVATAASAGIQTGTGSAIMDFKGDWSNTGTIEAAAGDTINLGGAFNPQDIGLSTMAGVTNGAFSPDGATVNISGTINNTGNNLNFAAVIGPWNLNGAVITDGTLTVQNGAGAQDIKILNASVQNTKLGSNLIIQNNGYSGGLTVNNTVANPLGLDFNGYNITLAGSYASLTFNATYDRVFAAYVPESVNGIINLAAYQSQLNGNQIAIFNSAINSYSTSGTNYIGGGTITNAGVVRVGSDGTLGNTVTGDTLTINSNNFTNAASGTIAVYNGDILNFNSYGGTTNAGLITTAGAATLQSGTASATINFSDGWSNTGTIRATAGDTINLGGTFNAADIGIAGATGQGAFTPNGATVNLSGTMNIQGGVATFDAAHGLINLGGGTFENGTVVAQNNTGTQYLAISSGTFQNITLGSNLSVAGSLYLTGTTENTNELNFNGYAVTLTGSGSVLNPYDVSVNGVYVPEVLSGTINLAGNNSSVNAYQGPLTLAGTLNALAPGNFNFIGGYSGPVTNTGLIYVGSAAIGGNAISGAALTVRPTFINAGTMTAFNSDFLNLNSNTWSNSGVIQTGVAAGLQAGPGSATLNIGGAGGNWSNSGRIVAAAGDTINLGGTFNAADIGIAGTAGEGTFAPNGATVNLTGTMNIQGGTATFDAAHGQMTLSSATIENGTLVSQDSRGNSYLNFGSATFQGVTLGSNLLVNGNNSTLTINGTLAVPQGLNIGGYAVTTSGSATNIVVNDADQYLSSGLVYSAQMLNGTINLAGAADTLTSQNSLTLAGTINALAADSYDTISNVAGILTNSGSLNGGSATVSGTALNIAGSAFVNSGTITQFAGDTLSLGSTVWSNTGTITGTGVGGGGINFGGQFTAADIGIAGTAGEGTFNPNGAKDVLNGTMNIQGGTATFDSAHGVFIFTGTIENGTLVTQVIGGNQLLQINGGTFQNVTLGSNLALGGPNDPNAITLTIANTASDAAGLVLNGNTVNLLGNSATLNYVDASNGSDVAQSIDSGVTNLSGKDAAINTNGTLTLEQGAVINSLAGNHGENIINGNSFVNQGLINVGSPTVTGNTLEILAAGFTNATTGVITVYNGNDLNISSANWINDGLIQTSGAAGLSSAGGASLTFNGSWTNNGQIKVTAFDVVNFGGSQQTGTGTISVAGYTPVQLTNTGSIAIGSATQNVSAFINAANFTNSSTGKLEVFTGSELQIGDIYTNSNSTNSGLIETSAAAGDTSASGATLTFAGNWSNTGTIAATYGDTVNLTGTFSMASIGLNGGGTQGTFTPGGANINLYGNIDQQGGSTLNLGQTGNPAHIGTLTIEKHGVYTLENGATLANAVLSIASGGGSSSYTGTVSVAGYANATFQNVTIGSLPTGSGIGLSNTGSTLTVANTVANPIGLNLGGTNVSLGGQNDALAFRDASNGGSDVAQTLDDMTTITGAGDTITTNGLLTLAGTVNVIIPVGNNKSGEAFLSGATIVNSGNINVGFDGTTSNTTANNILVINPVSFTNNSTGVITVYNSNVLDIAATNWSNAGTIQTAAAIGDTPAAGSGAVLEFNGSWTNTGTIRLTSFDEVVFGSNPGVGSTGTIGTAGQIVQASNAGKIDVGSAGTTGLYTLISTNTFTNSSTGKIEVFNGNTLLLGDPYGYPTTWSNAGTIASATAAGDQTGGGATIYFYGNWSNSGSIAASANDSVILGGNFTTKDIGMAAGGGSFTPGGAVVTLSGTMSLQGGAVSFGAALGAINLTGTLENGTLSSGTDTNGNEYLSVGAYSSGTFQNITLGTNYALVNNGSTLNVNNSLANGVGLDLGGKTLTLSGQNTTLRINNTLTNPNTLQNGTLTLSGAGAQLYAQSQMTLGATLTLNSTSTGGNGNFINGFGVVNAGNMNVGYDSNSGTTVTGNALAIYAGFTNVGTVTVYGGNNLFIGEPANLNGAGNYASTWSNSATIQSNDSFGGTSGITLQGNWSNTGTIVANPGDLVTLAGIFHPADVAMANDGSANATFNMNGTTTTAGAVVNITGTLVNSDAGASSSSNTLYFGAVGSSKSSTGSGNYTSNGSWNLGASNGSGGYLAGTIQGGTIYPQDSTGAQYLNIINGVFQNVTLQSNLNLNNANSSLTISNAGYVSGSPNSSTGTYDGLVFAGTGNYSINISGQNASLIYSDATYSGGGSVPQTIASGKINVTGTTDTISIHNGPVTLAANASINVYGTGTYVPSTSGSGYDGSGNYSGYYIPPSATINGSGSFSNLGNINVGSDGSGHNYSGIKLTIDPANFTNLGTITVFGGSGNYGANTLQIGNGNDSTTWTNKGTIQTNDADHGGAFITLTDNWSNTGSIVLSGSDRIELGGFFHPSDVAMANNGSTNATFIANGAAVNITGTLINSDGNGPNTLNFNGPGTSVSGTSTSNGTWNLSGGTIIGGVININAESNGNPYLTIGSGMLENATVNGNLKVGGMLTLANVALNGNIDLFAADSGISIFNSIANPQGLVSASPFTISTVYGGTINFNDVTDANGNPIGQTLANATINLAGQTYYSAFIRGGNGTLTIASSTVINGEVAGQGYYGNITYGNVDMLGSSIVNYGAINAGVGVSYQGLTVGSSIFVNHGIMTVEGGNNQLAFTAYGLPISLINAADGTITASGYGSDIFIDANWSNLGKIALGSGDTIELGGTFHPADVGLATDLPSGTPQGTFTPGNGTVNLTGTLVNADVGGNGPNTLDLVTGGTPWYFDGGTIKGGILIGEDASGNSYLSLKQSGQGTLQNVTLGSNLSLGGNSSTLYIANSTGAGNQNGITGTGQQVVINGSYESISFSDATDGGGNAIGQTLADLTIDLAGQNAGLSTGTSLTVASNATIEGTGYNYSNYYQNTISGGSLANLGNINAGSASATGYLIVEPKTFTNQVGGTMIAFNGSTLQIGSGAFGTTWSNAGTITTAVTAGLQTAPGTAVITLDDNWSNTGTISASAGDTINFGGKFHPADVGLATDLGTGATQGTLSPSQATLNLTGTLINSDTGPTGSNTLNFPVGGNIWNMTGGTVLGGSVIAQDNSGNQFLNIATGSFQNVSLQSNLALTPNYSRLTILNSAGTGLQNGLVTSGQTITLSGYLSELAFTDATDSLGNPIGQTLGNVTIDFTNSTTSTLAVGGSLTLSGNTVVNALAGTGNANGGVINGTTLINDGSMNAGSAGAAGSLEIVTTNFTNSQTGTLTAYPNSVLQIEPTAWSNAGVITGSTGSTIDLGGTFHPADIGLATDLAGGAGQGTFNTNGAQVNILGTLVNADAGGTGVNDLVFNAASGVYNLDGGTVQGGAISMATQTSGPGAGDGYLVFSGGTLQNVTLNSDLILNNAGQPAIQNISSLNINNTLANQVGLNTNGHNIILSGTSAALTFNDVVNTGTFAIAAQTLANTTITLSGANATITGTQELNFASTAIVNAVAANSGNIINGAIVDTGARVNVGSATPTATTLYLDPTTLTNSGVITVFNGDQLVFGLSNGTSANKTGGIIQTQTAVAGSGAGSAILTFVGPLTNSGTITAATGDTINLEGSFTAADVGLATAGPQGTFTPNGATVNFTGTLDNTGNALLFGPTTGAWNMSGNATIMGGSLSANMQSSGPDAGQPFLVITDGTFQNVTINSDLTVSGNLSFASTSANTTGVVDSGHTINIVAAGGTLTYVEPRDPFSGLAPAQTLNSTVNLLGAGSTISGSAGTALTLGTSAVINGLAANSSNTFTMTALTNNGQINAGSAAVTNNTLTVNVVQFANNGSITANTGSAVNLVFDPAASWTNMGTLSADVGGTINVKNNDGSPLNLILGTGSTIDIQIGSGGQSGLIDVLNGSLTIDPNVTLNLSLAPGAVVNGPYTLFNFTGLLGDHFATVNSSFGTVSYNADSITINGASTPEPAALALFAGGSALLLIGRGKRRNAKRNHVRVAC